MAGKTREKRKSESEKRKEALPSVASVAYQRLPRAFEPRRRGRPAYAKASARLLADTQKNNLFFHKKPYNYLYLVIFAYIYLSWVFHDVGALNLEADTASPEVRPPG
jgi:hypothetical protein